MRIHHMHLVNAHNSFMFSMIVLYVRIYLTECKESTFIINKHLSSLKTVVVWCNHCMELEFITNKEKALITNHHCLVPESQLR